MGVGNETIFDIVDQEENIKETDTKIEEINKAKKLLQANGYIVKK